MSQPNSSSMQDGFATFYAGEVDSPWIAYFGGDYTLNDNVGFSLYTSRLKDAWNQYYAGTTWSYPLADDVALIGGLNYYKAVDEGKQLLGSFDNNIWSGKVGLQVGAHTVLVGLQQNNGNDDSPTPSTSTTRSSTATSTPQRRSRGKCAMTWTWSHSVCRA